MSYQVKDEMKEEVSVGEGTDALEGVWLSSKGYPRPYLAGVWLLIRLFLQL